MNISQLQQGLRLQNQIREVQERLQKIRDYFQEHQTLTINVAGVQVDIPKAQVSQKIQTKIAELQTELADLQNQFQNL